MIGGLQYLAHSRQDIANAVEIVARFQVDPKEYHHIAVKRIFKYLKGHLIMEFGMQGCINTWKNLDLLKVQQIVSEKKMVC